jgi:CheY-like chemotaxis protein
MDGYTAASELRRQGYTGTIVAVTASAMSEEATKAIEAGCNHFISKPIGDDFEGQIQRMLDGVEP